MTAFADLSEYVNRMTGGNSGTPELLAWFKENRVGGAAGVTVAGRWTSLWRFEGSPSLGATPTTVAAPDNTTDGALKQSDAGGGREKWLGSCAAYGGVQGGSLVLYDRLLHIGGLSGTVTTAQTVGGTITRNTGGVGNIMFAEINTAIGATARTITASYTDNDGNSGQTSPAVAIGGTGLAEVNRMIPIPVAAGDRGVQAVASVTLSATTGTAGNFGIVLARPLLYIPIGAAGMGQAINFIDSIPKIDAGACLAWAFIASTTTGFSGGGMLAMVER